MTYDVSGDWLATVRVGQSLPFDKWQLILRDLRTGDTRTIAQSDPRVASVPGLPVGLPTGFAPAPSLSGSRVVWAEFVLDEQGRVQKRVELYDLTTRVTSTLATVDPSVEDLWQPSIGAHEVVWAHRPHRGAQELVTLDIATGRKRIYAVGGEIFSCALSDDGRYLAWDDGYIAKYALNLGSGDVVQYASDEGWGTNRSGNVVSWQPSAGGSFVSGQPSNGDGGFYAFDSREVRFISLQENAVIIMAAVMGKWFVWQERPISPASPPSESADSTASTTPSDSFYFMRLDS